MDRKCARTLPRIAKPLRPALEINIPDLSLGGGCTAGPTPHERNHQGLENRLLRPLCAVGEPHARVKRRQRLGGMLSYYHREAA